ncbi:MAG: S26 family signal peptidase, partial [Pseudomonadota bacterium]
MSASGHGGKRKEKTVRRRVWLAFLLGVVPGLGQLYNAMPGRAVSAVAVIVAVQVAMLGASLLPPDSMVIGFLQLGLLGVCGFFVVAIVLDAAIGAWRQGEITLRRFNHPAVYIAVLAGWIVESQLFDRMESAVSASITYPVIAGSMEPTLERGDFVFGHKGFYGENDVSRGDVVAFRKPGNED